MEARKMKQHVGISPFNDQNYFCTLSQAELFPFQGIKFPQWRLMDIFAIRHALLVF